MLSGNNAWRKAPKDRNALFQLFDVRMDAGKFDAALLQAALHAGEAQEALAIVQTQDGPATVKRWSEICTLGDA